MMEDSNSKIKQKARKIQPSQVLTVRFLFFCFQEKATQEKISYQAKIKKKNQERKRRCSDSEEWIRGFFLMVKSD